MNSKERHEVRYQRRKAKREAKAQEIAERTFDDVMSFENLVRAGKGCCNGSRWKTSTIHFETNLLSECQNIWSDLQNGTRKFNGFHSFTTAEHGKLRNIDALPIKDRAIQKCICSNLLTESYSRSFIFDNSASLPNKGMDFALRRLKKHLHDHFRKYGTEGGIYQFDFKNYFGSLPHDQIKERARGRIQDDRLYALFCNFVDEFQLMRTADKSTTHPHGVGLGSEISQIIALDYASPVDHYIKDTLGIHGYGRYMDDGYIISNNLEELQNINRDLHKLASTLGLQLSEKKCIITPFRHHGFRFLKMRISLTDTGKVVTRLSRKSIQSMRRKLHIFRVWLNDGRIGLSDIEQSYQSWRAYAKHCNSYRTLKNMDRLYEQLFHTGYQG